MSDPVQAQKTGYLEESPGVKSSKRLWGTILLSLGALIFVGVAVVSLFYGRNEVGAAVAAATSLLITGGGLLGLGVLEGLGQKAGGAA
jgi:hypothetical protein